MSARKHKQTKSAVTSNNAGPGPAAPPGLPPLEAFSGKCKAWALAAARDIKDYSAGVIPWSDVVRGCVVHGLPGTGKTTFAKAVARACNVPIVATSYPAWQRSRDGHLGNVLNAIRSDFRQAIEQAPSILFIDEIDGIPSRVRHSRNSDWWDSIVGALLQELDGITARDGVIVIAACNYVDRVDPALLRAGRLDTQIAIDVPSIDDLDNILRFHLGDDLPGADLHPVAVSAKGLTGADIAKLVRDARRQARIDERPLETKDLLAMLQADDANGAQDVERAATHEAGHAAVAILLGVSDNVTTSLIRRGQVVASTHIDARYEAITRRVVEDRATVALAGRAAELIILGSVSAGAGGTDTSDLAIATDLCIRAVACWGLSCLPNLIYFRDTRPEHIMALRPDLIAEVNTMLESAQDRANGLVEGHADDVRAIAASLAERRVLTHDEIVRLIDPSAR